MPEFREALPLLEIDEPALPVREAMDDAKLQELAQSMASTGLLQPISVKREGERFEIIAGHRRYTAARLLNWHHIRAMIFEPSEIAASAAMLAENLYREDLSAGEEAIWFHQLMVQNDLDEEGLCKLVKQSPDYIGDRLRLLRGDEMVLMALRKRDINFSVARELNKCDDESHRRYLLSQAISGGAPARLVTQWVTSHKINSAPSPAPMQDTQTEGVEETYTPYVRCCALCGGSKDQHNLVEVVMHKWEWENLQRLIEQGSKARE